MEPINCTECGHDVIIPIDTETSESDAESDVSEQSNSTSTVEYVTDTASDPTVLSMLNCNIL